MVAQMGTQILVFLMLTWIITAPLGAIIISWRMRYYVDDENTLLREKLHLLEIEMEKIKPKRR